LISQTPIDEFNLEIRIIVFFVIILIIFIIQWIVQLFISILSRRTKTIPLGAVNALKFLVRLTAAISGLYLMIVLFVVSLESIFGISALLGAIISFGSAQWVSNFISGLYILVTRPFGVNDFIALSQETQGKVVEISINYTKIQTIYGIYHLIPNRIFLKANIRVFNQKITRKIGSTEASMRFGDINVRDIYNIARSLIEEKVVRYTFTWSAPLGNLKETKFSLQRVCDIYAGVFGYKPEFFLRSMGYKQNFTFIVTTHTSDILINNFLDFRNEIVRQFH
jgi:hypothetical protein